jgi:hypothetical protein
MQTTAPYGYDEIVPLRKEHRVRLPEGATPEFARKVNALAVSLAEFAAAARDYPLVFASLDQGKTFAPVIVLGLEPGVNLFVGAGGDWDRGVYYPAFARRYPFCISKLYVDGKAHGERVVCVARSQLDDAAAPLFDAAGAPSAQWRAIERLLAEYEADLDRTAQMSATLAGFRLFEAFSEMNLSGMYRVSEARLVDLKASTHKLLVGRGYMGAIYAHLHSLQNFPRLRQRAAGRD